MCLQLLQVHNNASHAAWLAGYPARRLATLVDVRLPAVSAVLCVVSVLDLVVHVLYWTCTGTYSTFYYYSTTNWYYSSKIDIYSRSIETSECTIPVVHYRYRY